MKKKGFKATWDRIPNPPEMVQRLSEEQYFALMRLCEKFYRAGQRSKKK